MTTTQLRDYRIEQAHFDEFLVAWRSQVPALREQYGFRSQAWSVPEEARFVWILSRDGTREAFEAADARPTTPHPSAPPSTPIPPSGSPTRSTAS